MSSSMLVYGRDPRNLTPDLLEAQLQALSVLKLAARLGLLDERLELGLLQEE